MFFLLKAAQAVTLGYVDIEPNEVQIQSKEESAYDSVMKVWAQKAVNHGHRCGPQGLTVA